MSHEPPRSTEYGDTYYSAEDGWAESWHVFVRGNALEERFAALRHGEVFRLGELGFGTGLNIAAAMTAFAQRGHERGHLAVFSVEGHPLSAAEFASHADSAGARWPEARKATSALAACYPAIRKPGFATCRPAPGVTLTIGFGEVAEVMGQAMLRADAWFLDGFSPAVNPAMWDERVLGALARLSTPGATLSTFTVAGMVRRGLAATGFDVAKTKGFGRKREMLTGKLAREASPRPPAVLGQERGVADPPGGPVAVIGGGIAGASVAWHLARLGTEAVLFDPDGLAAGASGNPVGLVTPRTEAADNPVARFYRDAYGYALPFYRDTAPGACLSEGASIRTESGRAEKVLGTGLWPGRVLSLGNDGLYAPDALTLAPTDAVLALAAETRVVAEACVIDARGDGFAASWPGGEAAFRSVVIASPTEAARLDLAFGQPVLSGSAGQIDLFGGSWSETLSGDGYVAPFGAGLAAGATYDPVRLGASVAVQEERTARNRETAERLTGGPVGPSLGARAAVRAATPDRHPLAGLVPDLDALAMSHAPLQTGGAPLDEPAARPGLFVLSGLGSRGLLTAPLLGAYVAALAVGAPLPIARLGAEALHPARFAVRALRRRHA